MFTALAPSRQCGICRYANDEYQLVANSWRYSQSYSNKLYFALVDFDEGQEVFQQLKLNSAPVYMHFPAKGKPKKADTLDIQRIRVCSDLQIIPVCFMLVIVLVVVVGLLYFRKNSLDFLYNSTVWATGALAFTFAMISGQMWNHIRGPPFLHKTQGGNIAYIHGSSQGQFIIETYIVGLLHAAVVLGMILMTEAAGKRDDVRKRRIQAFIGLGLVAFFFSLQLSIFKSKAHGYPYSFLIK
ncbi:Magnesium transporter protein 1 [Armadillidium vulgare]|nr:Magnesium transporter protein 1 [Armadillidium vulgare]